MSMDEGAKIESWEKQKKEAMKVIKTMVKTKSGRLVEKIILMTEAEFREFQVDVLLFQLRVQVKY